LLSRNDNAGDTSLVAYMQQAWAEIGVKVTLEPLPAETLFERFDARKFEMAMLRASWSVDPGQGAMFGTGDGGNALGYSNAAYDQLEVEQRSTMDPAQRVDLIIDQAQIVWDELPIGVLAFIRQSVGHTKQLHNVFPNTFGLFWSAPFWYLEP